MIINYEDWNPDPAKRFFIDKQNILLQRAQLANIQARNQQLNMILAGAQQNIKDVLYGNSGVTESALAAAINSAMQDTMTQDISNAVENMVSNISTLASNANTNIQQYKDYLSGYQDLDSMFKQIMTKKIMVVSRTKLMNWIAKLHPSQLQSTWAQQKTKDIANPLGHIGEIQGSLLGYQIGMELIQQVFSQQGYKNLKVQVENVGDNKSGTEGALTTDTLVIIRSGNKIIYTLNLSNKMNTKFQADLNQKSTKYAVKLRSTTVSAFLKEAGSDWDEPVYNILSFHWITESGMMNAEGQPGGIRYDYYKQFGSIARQTIGIQMLYNHVFGTQGSFMVDKENFNDSVQLISYGNKIISGEQVLKQALFTKAFKERKRFNQVQIAENRNSWFKSQHFEPYAKSELRTEFDAEQKIMRWNLIYMQTLQFDTASLLQNTI